MLVQIYKRYNPEIYQYEYSKRWYDKSWLKKKSDVTYFLILCCAGPKKKESKLLKALMNTNLERQASMAITQGS